MADIEVWKKRVEDWRASGQSAGEYCKGQEFTAGTLHRWSSRLAELPQARAEETSVAPQAAASKEPMKDKTLRGDWAELLSRTFDFDVFAYVRCGGRRRVLA
jgi:hypothetical protein